MTIHFPNLHFWIDGVPQGFRIFGFSVTMFGIFVAAGVLACVIITLLRAGRTGVGVNHCMGMIIFSLLGGILGARALYVLCHLELYEGDILKILDIRSGGMAFYGGLLGGILFGLLYCAFSGQSFLELADTVTPGLVLGQAIARWGDFFMLQSFGEYTNNPLAMQLPLSGVRAGEVTDAMREQMITIDGVSYIQVSPVFLYESVACLLLFFFLLGKNPKKTFPGGIFFRYLQWYGLIRGISEWFRTDKLMVPGFPYSISLVISIALFVIFTLVVLVENDMYRKRETIRKNRQERHYLEEERIEQGLKDEEERERVQKDNEGRRPVERGPSTGGRPVPEQSSGTAEKRRPGEADHRRKPEVSGRTAYGERTPEPSGRTPYEEGRPDFSGSRSYVNIPEIPDPSAFGEKPGTGDKTGFEEVLSDEDRKSSWENLDTLDKV